MQLCIENISNILLMNRHQIMKDILETVKAATVPSAKWYQLKSFHIAAFRLHIKTHNLKVGTGD